MNKQQIQKELNELQAKEFSQEWLYDKLIATPETFLEAMADKIASDNCVSSVQIQGDALSVFYECLEHAESEDNNYSCDDLFQAWIAAKDQLHS